ncbi:DUF4190 domain-containing protein [Leucobacter sp. HY1910]
MTETPNDQQRPEDPTTPVAPGEPAAPAAPVAPVAPAAPAAPAYRAETPTAPAAPAGYPAGTPVPGKTLGIVGLVVSIFFGFVGLILSIVAVVQSKKAGAKNVPGIVGIVIGSISTLLGTLVGIFFIWATAQSLGWIETCAVDPYATINVFGTPFGCAELGLDPESLNDF